MQHIIHRAQFCSKFFLRKNLLRICQSKNLFATLRILEPEIFMFHLQNVDLLRLMYSRRTRYRRRYTRGGRIIRMPNVRQYTVDGVYLIYYRGNVALTTSYSVIFKAAAGCCCCSRCSALHKTFELLCAYSMCISVTLKTFQSNATLSVMFASRMCYAHYENISGMFRESTRVYYIRIPCPRY